MDRRFLLPMSAMPGVVVEPHIMAKKSLTGDTTERVATRFLQVLLTFDRRDLPIHGGQQMDVCIDAAGAGIMPAN